MSEKKELTDEEVFVPNPDEGIWTAKPLTVRTTVLLVRMLAEVLARAAMGFEEFFPNGEITEGGVVALLELMDEPLLYNVLYVITGAKRKEIDADYSLRNVIHVIMEFWEKEEISDILGEATNLARSQEFRERNVGSQKS